MNLQNFQVVDTGQVFSFDFQGQTLSMPIMVLSGTLYDEHNNLLADYTGDKSIIFPAFLASIPFTTTGNLSLFQLVSEYGPDLLGYKYWMENK